MVDERGRARSLQRGLQPGSARGYPSQERAKSAGCGALLLCCALGVGAWAAEDSAPDMEELPADDDQELDSAAPPGSETSADAQSDASEATAAESPDTFIPSENISENIAVKFPVDI